MVALLPPSVLTPQIREVGDAAPILLNEAHALSNSSPQDLEFMMIGIARDKGVLDTMELE